MKKLMIISVMFAACIILFAQNQPQNDELANLRKQVSTLNNSSAKIDRQVKTFIKTSKSIQDSLKMRLESNDQKIKALNDSVISKELQIKLLGTEVEKNSSDLKKSSVVHIVFLLLILIIIAAVYFVITGKVNKEGEKNEVRHLNTKEWIDVELKKIKKDLEEAEKKIEEMKK
jgi:hypothetical protein